jgi:hypothetical protein
MIETDRSMGEATIGTDRSGRSNNRDKKEQAKQQSRQTGAGEAIIETDRDRKEQAKQQ